MSNIIIKVIKKKHNKVNKDIFVYIIYNKLYSNLTGNEEHGQF